MSRTTIKLGVDRFRLPDGRLVDEDTLIASVPPEDVLDTVEHVGLDVEVTGTVVPYVPARTWGLPELCYPEEGGEVEDIEATLNGQAFELTESEGEQAEEKLRERAAEYDGPDPDDYRDSFDD